MAVIMRGDALRSLKEQGLIAGRTVTRLPEGTVVFRRNGRQVPPMLGRLPRVSQTPEYFSGR
jgi:hypothetical protein